MLASVASKNRSANGNESAHWRSGFRGSAHSLSSRSEIDDYNEIIAFKTGAALWQASRFETWTSKRRNLSKLSVWWLRLGIRIERIKPGNPQQNGRHERMHLTLKKEATKPAAKNFLQQQAKFDEFIECYNRERPHQAINMRYPAELYEPSPRPYQGLADLEYPFHDRTVTVTRCGRICFGRQKINLSQVFAGQNVGVKEVSERIWLVSFMDYDLGFFDDETCRLESAINPFEAKVLPMSPV